MIIHRRATIVAALLLGAGAMLSIGMNPQGGVGFVSSAHAQGFIKNLIARLRGET